MPRRIVPKRNTPAQSLSNQQKLIDIGFQLVIEVFELQRIYFSNKNLRVQLDNFTCVEKLLNLAQNWLFTVIESRRGR